MTDCLNCISPHVFFHSVEWGFKCSKLGAFNMAIANMMMPQLTSSHLLFGKGQGAVSQLTSSNIPLKQKKNFHNHHAMALPKDGKHNSVKAIRQSSTSSKSFSEVMKYDTKPHFMHKYFRGNPLEITSNI